MTYEQALDIGLAAFLASLCVLVGVWIWINRRLHPDYEPRKIGGYWVTPAPFREQETWSSTFPREDR